jgi:hypothetical protein
MARLSIDFVIYKSVQTTMINPNGLQKAPELPKLLEPEQQMVPNILNVLFLLLVCFHHKLKKPFLYKIWEMIV